MLGIAPLAGDCRALSNTPAFAFANQHPANDRVTNICWTVAQEASHAYGLDHEFVFVDGGSACIDPMTYRTDCGGEKFFRDRDAYCGETEKKDCTCPGTQNSHQNLLGKFGAGTVTTAAPTVSIVVPLDQTTFVQGQAVQARAKAQRGVTRLDLYLNGYRWMTVPGGGFGPDGQPESTYPFVPPSAVPDGVIDIVVKARDDLGIETASSTVTVTKGLPCADAASCAVGQKCEAGKCFWDPATGELGAACEYKQSCVSDLCQDGVCEQACDAAGPPTCPGGYTCGEGFCVTVDGGCCSVSGPGAGWLHGGFAGIVLVVVLRRRPARHKKKEHP
ncbi:MAG: Ig-like domain-containing protein [Deltaproteobacteria bacterium]|nr:Ig-like domain-containing protein [Deltaproteobacteria bacterium]